MLLVVGIGSIGGDIKARAGGINHPLCQHGQGGRDAHQVAHFKGGAHLTGQARIVACQSGGLGDEIIGDAVQR